MDNHQTVADTDVARAEDITERCRALFAGHHPSLQGAVLTELFATWLAGHRPEARERLLAVHVDGVRELLPHLDPYPPAGKLNG